ncbi:hypothetical protein QBC46DRAFT_426806 [Diplogelasinospora grovesii]|uniref:Extracellular membrane protein CFEM domain-containing protein n=1 Tax=Diplogelasinospora grovesii TaxID=303347 RepID=A0AAN6S6Z2_9PEZI|nr:hypothetical protein QBC46DRAFT_426806 [Diplogelasinospora grovesii]
MARLSSCLVLIAVLGAAREAAALNLRIGVPVGGGLGLHDTTPAAFAPAHPEITQAPSPKALDLQLRGAMLSPRAATGMDCCTSCVEAAVTKSTTCSLGDHTCECQSANADLIYIGAYGCVMNCGVVVANSYWTSATSVCAAVLAGTYTSSTVNANADTTSTVTVDASTSVAVVTRTNAAGSVTVVTSTVVSSPTDSSSSGGSSSGGGGLPSGAIAGIAVGAAGGAIILCAILFMIWRFCMKKQAGGGATAAPAAATSEYAPVSQQPPPTNPSTPAPGYTPAAVPVAVGETEGKSELGGEPKVHPIESQSASPMSHVPGRLSGISPHPTLVSTPSPAPVNSTQVQSAAAVPVQQQQQQQPQYSNMAELPPWQQQQQQYQQQQPGGYFPVQQQQQQPMYPPQGGYGQPIPGVSYAQVQDARPEVMGDTQIRQELHGQAYGSGVYEMPGGPAPPR